MSRCARYDKVIVSLTTIPSRVVFLRETIASLLSQTYGPISIELNIPISYRRKNLGSIDVSLLPKEISLFRCEDSGPATKILPTLSRYGGQNVCVIYCDDDRIYDKNMVMRLLNCYRNYPRSAIADEVVEIKSRYYSRKHTKDMKYRLRRFFSGGRWKPNRNNPNEGQIAQGFGGVLVRPDFFAIKTFDVDEEFFMVDDIWLSAMLAHNNIEIKFSGRTKTEKSKPVIVDGRDLGRSADALVNTAHQDLTRNDVDWRAITVASARYGVWTDEVKRLQLTRKSL